MRRTLAIVAALLMVAALGACGGGHSLTPASQNAAPPSTKIDLTGWTMPDLPATVPPAPDNPEQLWQRQKSAAPKSASGVYDIGLTAGPGPHTLSASGQPPSPPGPGTYYQYLTSNPGATVDAQNYSEVHVHGRIVSHSMREMIYAELGLVTWETWDYAVNQQNVPSYMFNQNVFMIVALDNNGIPFAAPMDKNGSAFMGPARLIPASFDFDLWLSPNVGGTGGTMRLSINGSPYSAPFAYGTDNWGWRPAEDFSSSMLLANIYSANYLGETGTITIQNLRVSEGPVAADSRGEWYTRGRTQLRTAESPRNGPQNGGIQWSTSANGLSLFGGPGYASDGTIYYTAGNFLYAYYPDGSLRWAYNAGEFCGRGGVTVGSDGTVYFGASGGSAASQVWYGKT